MYAGGLMSPMQRCFSDLVCQPLVTSCVIDAYSLFGRVARLDPGVPAHDALRLMVDTIRKQKANGQLENTAGSPSQRLDQQGSGGCQRSTAIYAVEI